MNTVTIVHPRLQHIGMTTPNIDAMVKWYRTVVGMDPSHRVCRKYRKRRASPQSCMGDQ